MHVKTGRQKHRMAQLWTCWQEVSCDAYEYWIGTFTDQNCVTISGMGRTGEVLAARDPRTRMPGQQRWATRWEPDEEPDEIEVKGYNNESMETILSIESLGEAENR
jgi:hypothetical protein